MTEADLAHVEAHLGRLPAEYRRFLIDATPADWRGFKGIPYNVEALIRENARLRRWPEDSPVVQPDDTTAPWPAGWWAVSDSGDGDHWFVRDEDDGRSVWFWSHESRETCQDAPTIAEFLADGRDIRERYGRPTETIDHPTLGPLAFDGSSYTLPGPLPVFVLVDRLHDDPASRHSALDAAARLIPEALAGERRVLEAALPRLVALQHEPAWWRPNAPKLTADQIREQLTPANLSIQVDQAEDGFELKLDYVYAGSRLFAWDLLNVECGPDLSVRDVLPLG